MDDGLPWGKIEGEDLALAEGVALDVEDFALLDFWGVPLGLPDG